jgi:hypothetical protein
MSHVSQCEYSESAHGDEGFGLQVEVSLLCLVPEFRAAIRCQHQRIRHSTTPQAALHCLLKVTH